jgi:L,D-peptidoglycan transpeptidase YkuD (ErfK/YbiS/YcfS/YnhG family)
LGTAGPPTPTIAVDPTGELRWAGRHYRCALGRGGVRADKREGDGATPAGRFPLRRVLYRPDRLPPPATQLPIAPMAPDDGWCDAPGDPMYNRPVRLPYSGCRHEQMWRADGLYDLVVVIGHNDDPVVPGMGSAIFLHVASRDYRSTEGCIALARGDLLALLAEIGPEAMLEVTPVR